MLSDEFSNRPYNKAAHNRVLQESIGRSRGSIEFKLCNMSAVCRELGLSLIKAYQPRFNFQMYLAEAAPRWVAWNPEWELALHKKGARQMAEPSPLFVDVAPTLINTPPPEELDQMQRVACRFDVADRDERNRALVLSGEVCVFHHERSVLQQKRRADLTDRVRWVSQEGGDGAGYDIASSLMRATSA